MDDRYFPWMWFDPLGAYPVSYFMADIEIKGMVVSRGSIVSYDDLPLFFLQEWKMGIYKERICKFEVG